jgi:thiamine-monophosphate kinase
VAPDELTIIDRFFRPLAGEGGFGLFDDAARLDVPPGRELVVTTDMIAEGVHFLASDSSDTIAQKALRVNLSDLAAKGAAPLAYVLSFGPGKGVDEAWLARFADGLRRDQEQFGVRLIGGDTMAAPRETVICVTAFGAAPEGRMVHRFGGRPGDALYVSGVIGAAVAGLAILKGEDGPWSRLPSEAGEALVARYRVPEPRVALAPVLAEYASAAMDISDGLVGDCDKLASASGCAATINVENVPLPNVLASQDEALLAKLLTGGDDYEILAAIPPRCEREFADAARAAGVGVLRIGALKEGREPTEVLLRGRPLALERRSFVHGRDGK